MINTLIIFRHIFKRSSRLLSYALLLRFEGLEAVLVGRPALLRPAYPQCPPRSAHALPSRPVVFFLREFSPKLVLLALHRWRRRLIECLSLEVCGVEAQVLLQGLAICLLDVEQPILQLLDLWHLGARAVQHVRDLVAHLLEELVLLVGARHVHLEQKTHEPM